MHPASTPEDLARRYVWWQTPADALRAQDHLLCQLMQLGTAEDIHVARGCFGDDAFRAALRGAAPGILDARSWTFWHRFWFDAPAPPLPSRSIP